VPVGLLVSDLSAGEPPAGMTNSLIDSEGYPRGDIDIYNVKNKRARLRSVNNGVCIQYIALMFCQFTISYFSCCACVA
jgi:hypothetical protein